MTEGELTQVRDAIDEVLAAALAGEEDVALDRLARLADLSEHSIRFAAWELAMANVDMLRALTDLSGPSEEEPAIRFELRDPDGRPVSIDELDPPLRSAMRIVLALTDGHEDDAREQLAMVHRIGAPADRAAVLAQMLAWALELLNACQLADQQPPYWLRPALSGGR